MNINTRQLRALQQIARLKSFTRAAEQLHATQAGLSAMIRDLEEQLGSRVFDRTTRSVRLTEAGTTLLNCAERIIQDFDGTVATINQADASSRRILSIAATPFISSSLLPMVCQRFARIRPEVTVRVRDLAHDEVRNRVETGECDVGFGVFLKAASGIDRAPVFDFDLVHVSRSEQALQARNVRDLWSNRPVPWRALKDTALLGLPPANPIQHLVDVHLRKIGRENEDRPYYQSFHTVLSMIEAGFGTAILPSFVAGAAVGRPLGMEHINKPQVSLPLFRIFDKSRGLSDSARDFIACMTETITEHWSNE